MIRKTPKTFNLENSFPELTCRPGEDFKCKLDFKANMTGATIDVIYKEFQWPYMSSSYGQLMSSELDQNNITLTDNDGIVNSVLNVKFPAALTGEIGPRKLDFQIRVTMDGETWVAADRTLTIHQGD